MRAAIRFVVIDEPPDIDRLDERAMLVEEVDGAFHPAEQFHSLRMVRNERVDEPRSLVDEIPGAGDPVLLQVARATLQADHDDRSVMLVGANDT